MTAVTVAKDDTAWAGTAEDRSRVDEGEGSTPVSDGAVHVGAAVAVADDGRVRTGNESSVAAFDGESWEVHSTPAGRVEHNPVLALEVDDGTVVGDTRGEGVWEIPRDE